MGITIFNIFIWGVVSLVLWSEISFYGDAKFYDHKTSPMKILNTVIPIIIQVKTIIGGGEQQFLSGSCSVEWLVALTSGHVVIYVINLCSTQITFKANSAYGY